VSPFGKTSDSTWLGDDPVIVADADGPLVTVPMVSVFAGPAAPALPVAPASPCGPVLPVSPFGSTRFSTWLGAAPVSVADAEVPPTTVPIDSVFAGPVAPAAPTGPATPCGPTPPLADTDELELVTVADTEAPLAVTLIGCDVTVAVTLLTALPPRLRRSLACVQQPAE
jgi:hypothetical protein